MGQTQQERAEAKEIKNLKNRVNYLISKAVKTVKVTLTAAQLKTSNTVPVVIVPAPGVGKHIIPLYASGKTNWNSVAFDAQDLYLLMSAYVFTDNNFLLGATSDTRVSFGPIADFNFVENTAITLNTLADSVATGDSTIDIYVTYSIGNE